MRKIEYSTAFKRDYKRAKADTRHRRNLDLLLEEILSALLVDGPLSPRLHDHALAGDWSGYRECHIKPDLLLIYQKPDATTLRLVRLGSHSDVFE